MTGGSRSLGADRIQRVVHRRDQGSRQCSVLVFRVTTVGAGSTTVDSSISAPTGTAVGFTGRWIVGRHERIMLQFFPIILLRIAQKFPRLFSILFSTFFDYIH